MSNTDNKVTGSKFSIVNQIATILKIGDFGKVESFINRIDSTLTREISTANRNISNIKHNLEGKIALQKEHLADAEKEVEDAYLEVSPEDVATNQKQRAFMETYLDHIEVKEAAVAKVEKTIEDLNEQAKDDIDAQEKKIAVRKSRIALITKGKKQ